jgi:hypothetical protein
LFQSPGFHLGRCFVGRKWCPYRKSLTNTLLLNKD